MPLDRSILRAGQIIISRFGPQRIHLYDIEAGQDYRMVPVEVATILRVLGEDLVIRVPNEPSIYSVPFRYFGTWRVVDAPIRLVPSEQWLKPGVWVDDIVVVRDSGDHCLISGVNEFVNLRCGTTSLKYTLEEALVRLVPRPISLPQWVVLGAQIQSIETEQSASHARSIAMPGQMRTRLFVVRGIDVFTRKVMISPPSTNTITTVAATVLTSQWRPHRETNGTITRPPIQPWFRGGIFVMHMSTGGSFWVQSVNETDGTISLRAVTWCKGEGEGSSMVPEVGSSRRTVQNTDTYQYEKLDNQGQLVTGVVCPNCNGFGRVIGLVAATHRVYGCDLKHEWTVPYDGFEDGCFLRTRYDIEIELDV